MTAFRISASLVCLFLALSAFPAGAQAPDGRDASPAVSQPVPLVPQSNPPAGPPESAAQAPPVTAPPVLSLPPTAAAKPVTLAAPVESGFLQGINADSIGLLSAEDGGLGAAMWKGTTREMVDRLLPTLTLPTVSPALNGLARRFLLTTANVPEGPPGTGPGLTALRIEKLVMLGNAVDAWNLAQLAKPGQIDDAALRLAAEAALVSSAGKDVCDKLPGIIQSHSDAEWQKSLVTCQLRAGNTTAAQLGLEVLHTQDVNDDTFFELAEHNIIGGAKSLPRHLTPLKPLTLALLLIIDQPLPPEVYAHPDAAAIPELLKAKSRDDKARLSLAESAAARGIISAPELASAYRSIAFPAADIANPPVNQEPNAKARALLYQAALQEKTPQKRFNEAERFMQSLDPQNLNGATAQILTEMIGNVTPSGDYAAYAATALRIFLLANKPDEAAAWLKVARQAITAAPHIADQLQDIWPLIVLGGIESDSDYARNFGVWLEAALKGADYARREQIGGLLSSFEAAGFAVPESAWMRVVDQPKDERRSAAPTLLLEGLRTAAALNRRGEAVLLALVMAGSNGDEFSLLPAVETIRALRLVSLNADALAFARETANILLAPPAMAIPPR